jgi:hypothetical protein
MNKLNIISKIKEALHDLIHGRPIPSRHERNATTITVDIRRMTESVQSIEDMTKIAIRAIESQEWDGKPVVLPFDSPFDLETLTEGNRELIFKFVLKRLQRAIQNNLPVANLFQLGSSHKMVQVSKKNFETQLTSLMDWFVKTEDYESASNCRDLIRQIKVNDAVDQ